MQRSTSTFAACLLVFGGACLMTPPEPRIADAGAPVGTAATGPSASAAYSAPLRALAPAFVPNVGQWQHGAAFVARLGPMHVFLEDHGWTFTLEERGGVSARARGAAVRMTFADAGTSELRAERLLPGRHHYFLGSDATRWRRDVRRYGAVRYRELHPGIDVRARAQDGHFEFDLLVDPVAALETVDVLVEGADGMHLDEDGALVIETSLGPVRMPAPPSWEQGPSGEVAEIACGYELRGGGRFGFVTHRRRPDWSLVVDPGLVWSTMLGGTLLDVPHAVAVDTRGSATVVGHTASGNFPVTLGAYAVSYNAGWDTFVTRLSSDGTTLEYSTYLGGSQNEQPKDVAVDAQGSATVVGFTTSADFPVTPGAFDTTFDGATDGFVTRLSVDGSALVYSTFLGGSQTDTGTAVAVDAQGLATVGGTTGSADFPTSPGAYQTSATGGGFVTRLAADGSSLVWSTYFAAGIGDLAVEPQGAATLVGRTDSSTFPTTSGAFAPTHSGGDDGFVTRLAADGSSLVWSTYLGGPDDEDASGVALDAQGAVTVAGRTTGASFPTTAGVFDRTFNGGTDDVYVARLSPSGSSLVWSTYLGGANTDKMSGVALDAGGGVTVAVWTASADFPTTPGAFDRTYGGGGFSDAAVARLSSTGADLLYSTYVGAAGSDTPAGLALDVLGAATVTGNTNSAGFPVTAGAFQTTLRGGSDGFATRLDLLPRGVSSHGTSSPGCTGPLAMGVTSWPQVGNAAFAVTTANAQSSSTRGSLLLSTTTLATPVTVLGVELWVGTAPPAVVMLLPAASDTVGAATVALPIPGNPALVGGRFAAQFLWAGPSWPPPCPPSGLSASHALSITIQP